MGTSGTTSRDGGERGCCFGSTVPSWVAEITTASATGPAAMLVVVTNPPSTLSRPRLAKLTVGPDEMGSAGNGYVAPCRPSA